MTTENTQSNNAFYSLLLDSLHKAETKTQYISICEHIEYLFENNYLDTIQYGNLIHEIIADLNSPTEVVDSLAPKMKNSQVRKITKHPNLSGEALYNLYVTWKEKPRSEEVLKNISEHPNFNTYLRGLAKENSLPDDIPQDWLQEIIL
jgi:hypothetical protein